METTREGQDKQDVGMDSQHLERNSSKWCGLPEDVTGLTVQLAAIYAVGGKFWVAKVQVKRCGGIRSGADIRYAAGPYGRPGPVPTLPGRVGSVSPVSEA